ncbi:hypothetical protein EXIGLDRAFT_630613 [Exidia glandulosa HHB12029]|uniref:Uncharacterized protein n=1 Tax=Exidia glandulosa HHB12029 TaxID=1314781 RepID=A0A165BAS6_EXIGL|nr:hypothetical protein EXIGLDRAFT_630613 [Exidia glandulosa HHB12029]
MQKTWNSPVYAFFKPDVIIGYSKGRRYHEFICAAQPCKKASHTVRRFLDTRDRSSTSNLRTHAIGCFGHDTVKKTLGETIGHMRDGSITASFERAGKGKVTFSHKLMTKTESRYLMLTGRPSHYIPSIATVSRDVRTVFVNCRQRIAKLLKEYDGELSFATDTWTSPNHQPLMAVTVTFVFKDEPLTLLLDVVELSKVCTVYLHAPEFDLDAPPYHSAIRG